MRMIFLIHIRGVTGRFNTVSPRRPFYPTEAGALDELTEGLCSPTRSVTRRNGFLQHHQEPDQLPAKGLGAFALGTEEPAGKAYGFRIQNKEKLARSLVDQLSGPYLT